MASLKQSQKLKDIFCDETLSEDDSNEDDALTTTATSIQLLQDQGDILAENGKYIEALSIYSKALRRCSTTSSSIAPALFDRKAQLLNELEQYFEAVLAAETAVKLDGECNSAYLLTYAQCLLNFGEPGKALEILEKAETRTNTFTKAELLNDIRADQARAAKMVELSSTSQLRLTCINDRIVGYTPFWETSLPVDHSQDPDFKSHAYKF